MSAVTGVPELHPAVAPLALLLGEWAGTGSGWYPTIDDFEYRETVTFGHVGKPFLSYGQRTSALDDGRPLHAETGYWRGSGAGELEIVIAHPFGAAEVSTGSCRLTASGLVIELVSIAVTSTPTSRQVTEVRRDVEVSGNELRYRVAMAAVGRPLQDHLTAVLTRV